MTDDLQRVSEFDVFIDEGAPRDGISEVVMERARMLLHQHRVPFSANVILATSHMDKCPLVGLSKRGHEFTTCTCSCVRIHVLVASDRMIREGEGQGVLSRPFSPIEEGEGN